MADEKQVEILKKGKDTWNRWRKDNPSTKPDLTGIEIAPREKKYGQVKVAKSIHEMNVDLSPVTKTFGIKNMSEKYSGFDFSDALLDGARNFNNHNLSSMILHGASMIGCNFYNQEMIGLNLRGVNLKGANLEGVRINDTVLKDSNLQGVNLKRSIIINTDLSNCNLSDTKVFGISTWDLKLNNSIQKNILITQDDQPAIVIDNLKVAQFIYLLINNSEIRDVIDTVANKAVLILGNFSPDRIKILYQVRDKLRCAGYIPILFDFDKPSSRDTTETIITLAHMSKFIIADLSSQRSVPHELSHIIPRLEVPVKPIIASKIDGETQHPYGMFKDLRKYRWVLETYHYDSPEQLNKDFEKQIIEPLLSYKKI